MDYSSWHAWENIFLHKKVSIYKVYSTISMNRTHLFLTVNTNTWWKAELHLTKVGGFHWAYFYTLYDFGRKLVMHSLILWFYVYQPDVYFNCKMKLCLGRQGKYFYTRGFYLQGLLNKINEEDTSSLDCKHKHMTKSSAPPDKVRDLYRIFTYRIPWFHKQNQFLGLSLLVPGLIPFF